MTMWRHLSLAAILAFCSSFLRCATVNIDINTLSNDTQFCPWYSLGSTQTFTFTIGPDPPAGQLDGTDFVWSQGALVTPPSSKTLFSSVTGPGITGTPTISGMQVFAVALIHTNSIELFWGSFLGSTGLKHPVGGNIGAIAIGQEVTLVGLTFGGDRTKPPPSLSTYLQPYYGTYTATAGAQLAISSTPISCMLTITSLTFGEGTSPSPSPFPFPSASPIPVKATTTPAEDSSSAGLYGLFALIVLPIITFIGLGYVVYIYFYSTVETTAGSEERNTTHAYLPRPYVPSPLPSPMLSSGYLGPM